MLTSPPGETNAPQIFQQYPHNNQKPYAHDQAAEFVDFNLSGARETG